MALTKSDIADRATILAIQVGDFLDVYIEHVAECYAEDEAYSKEDGPTKEEFAKEMRLAADENYPHMLTLLGLVLGNGRTCMLALLKAIESALITSVNHNTTMRALKEDDR